ncbi:transposase-like protein [Trichonephila clavipes]|nr:transposase-like protein [Trichonephila clavipes]
MPIYTHREMADMHLIYGMAKCNGREALRMYRVKYLCRQLPSRSFFATLRQRLCETGSFNVHKLDTGRQRTTRTVDAEDRVLQELERNPSTSTRVVSRETHIPKLPSGALHTTKDYILIIYNASRHWNWETTTNVWILRGGFCTKVMQTKLRRSVLFTDEATFSLEGVMNFHNLHTWADENPHAIRPHGAQRKCSINAWAGIVGDYLLGPYILPERLNGSMYLTFLQEVLPEMLNDVPMPIRQRIRFQHDGAPAHFSIDVRAHLQNTFPGGWIGRGGPIAWPARSPDLSPLDFFLWGFLKGLVYETPVATLEDLVGRIVEAAGCVRDTPGIFEMVRCSMQRRFQACLDVSEKNFEHLL